MLDIRNLTCGYGKDPVLRDVSVSVRVGEFVAIIGPNGSGKTTLLRAASKVVKPTSGAVLLDGRDIRHLSFRDLARRIAMVTNLKDTELTMSVEDFVLLGRIPHRKGIMLTENNADCEGVHKALALTDTLGLKRRRVDNLSSGEKQMVYIARALAQEPTASPPRRAYQPSGYYPPGQGIGPYQETQPGTGPYGNHRAS